MRVLLLAAACTAPVVVDEGAACDLKRPAKSLGQVHLLFELLEEEGICEIRIGRACLPEYCKRMRWYDDSWEAPRGIYGEELEN